MNNSRFQFYQPPSSPLARAALVVLGFGLLTLSFFLGLVFLIVAVGLTLIAAVAVAVRRWLTPGRPRSADGDSLNVEYRVIRRERREKFDDD